VNNRSGDKPPADMTDTVRNMKAGGDQFAVATVVRTVSVTAAKPGAKAIINDTGDIVEGWIGGGCARSAVVKAAVKSIKDGEPRLVTIQPEELLKEQGLESGEEYDGLVAANNMCPSRGSMEIFVEPVLSDPELLILGASPVASMLAELAKSFAFTVMRSAGESENEAGGFSYQNYSDIPQSHNHRYIVVATQGSGDINALQAAIGLSARQVSFVGSPKKTQHLKEKLIEAGGDTASVNAIKGPAGIDIGGVTPQEIALSILAEIISLHRKK